MTDTSFRPHGHMWVMGVVGAVAGLILLVFVPSLSLISKSLLLFAGFHVVGAAVLLMSVYATALRGVVRRWTGAEGRALRSDDYDFGWSPGWMNGLAVAALVSVAAAVALVVSVPPLWPLSFLLVAAGTVFEVGNVIMRGFRRRDQVVLPMVNLLSGDADLVMDAGCGTGRTTIAVSRILGGGKIVGLDRFDAGYIDDGGRALLDHNLSIAGLTDGVSIVTGDLSAMPFPDAHFDSIVSTHVYDHLGRHKHSILVETLRVMKPGARFLMAVWTPGWSMFAVASVFSLFLTSRAAWRDLATSAGFDIVDEGVCNSAWFLLLQKPR